MIKTQENYRTKKLPTAAQWPNWKCLLYEQPAEHTIRNRAHNTAHVETYCWVGDTVTGSGKLLIQHVPLVLPKLTPTICASELP